MVNYIHKVSNCLEGSIFFAEKIGFAKQSRLTERNSNISHELKIACYSLSVFIVIKLRTIY